MADSLQVKLGADTSEFRGALAQASQQANEFGAKLNGAGKSAESGFGASLKGLHHSVREFHALLTAGGSVTLVREFFNSAIEYAEHAKGSIDDATLAVQRFGRSFKEDNIWGKLAAEVTGFANQAGEGLGAVLRATYEYARGNKKAFSEAATEMRGMVDASRALSEIEQERAKNGEEYKRINETITREKEKQKRIDDEHLSVEQRAVKAERELFELVKKRINYSGDKIGERRLDAQIAEAQSHADDTAFAASKKHAEFKLRMINDIVAAIGKEVTHGEKRVKQEAKVNEELARQVKIYGEALRQKEVMEALDQHQARQDLLLKDSITLHGKSYGTSLSPEDLQGASNADLKKLIDQDQAEIRKIWREKTSGATALADAATNFLPQGIVAGRLQTDINRAQFQISQRAKAGGDENTPILKQIASRISDVNKKLQGAGFDDNGLRSGRGY